MQRRPRVLVVDDESVVRASLDRVLSAGGFSVAGVPNGASALERIEREEFDIAFVDLKMPGMPGIQVARHIRTRQPTVQLVIITGYGTADSATEAATLGVSDFVSKPLTPGMICAVAEQAWQRRQRILEHLDRMEAKAEAVGLEPVDSAVEPGVAAAIGLPEAAAETAVPSVEAAPPAVGIEAAPAAPAAPQPVEEARLPLWRGTLELLAGALLGLAYVIFLPLLGLAVVAWAVGRKLRGLVRRAGRRV